MGRCFAGHLGDVGNGGDYVDLPSDQIRPLREESARRRRNQKQSTVIVTVVSKSCASPWAKTAILAVLWQDFGRAGFWEI